MPRLVLPNLIVVVRHGESVRNTARGNNLYLPTDEVLKFKNLSDREVPLTPIGASQAEQTANALFERFGMFDVVYHSGYRRTMQTAQPYIDLVHKHHPGNGMKIRPDDDLRERDVGYTYSMDQKAVDKHFPWFQEYWNRNGYFDGVPPGGESQAQTCRRVYGFNGRMLRHRPEKRVAIFSHGGTIRAIRYNFERWTAEEYMDRLKKEQSPINCGVTVYAKNSSGKLELTEYNTKYWTD